MKKLLQRYIFECLALLLIPGLLLLGQSQFSGGGGSGGAFSTLTGQLDPTTQIGTGSGAISLTAGGTNQNITLTPSGIGNVLIGTSSDKAQIIFNNTSPLATFGNFSTAGSNLFGFSVPGNALISLDGNTDNVNFEASAIFGGGSVTAPGAISPNFTVDVRGSVGATSYHTPTAMFVSSTAPTIASGFGTTPSITHSNGTAAFTINVGTGGTAQTGVLTMPAATTGWVVNCTDVTTSNSTVDVTKQIGVGTTTSVTIGNFTDLGAAGAWAASDILACTAMAY